MANWRLAESLKQLRVEINAAFPNRSLASEGSIGDASHSARSSDHNPNGSGVVCAIDVTSDPRSGCTGDRLAAALIASRDPRIKYVIWNRRIIASYPTGGKPAWTWRPYSGKNAHAHHLHISVAADPNLYDSKAEWNLDFDISVVQSESLTSSRDTIQNSVAVADSPKSASSLETLQDEIQEGASQQVSESASGTQVVVNPSTPQTVLPIVPQDEPAIDVQTVTPEKTGARKSIWATIIAGISFLGLNIQAFFSNVYATVKDNPAATLGLIVGCLVIVIVYWKYQERQTKLDEQREKQAFELTKLQMELTANQQKYSINLVKAK